MTEKKNFPTTLEMKEKVTAHGLLTPARGVLGVRYFAGLWEAWSPERDGRIPLDSMNWRTRICGLGIVLLGLRCERKNLFNCINSHFKSTRPWVCGYVDGWDWIPEPGPVPLQKWEWASNQARYNAGWERGRADAEALIPGEQQW